MSDMDYGRAAPPPSLSCSLEVIGQALSLVEPTSFPDQIRWLHAGADQLPLPGQPEVFADRYDVRHLLEPSELALIDEYNQSHDCDRADFYSQDDPDVVLTADQLDALNDERYHDLPDEAPTQPFIHVSRQTLMNRETYKEIPPVAFQPSFHVPDHITTLPSSSDQHTIIEKTAMFVREKGAQPELLLKVRQAQNPKFAFLNSDHPLHVYYQYLKETGVQHSDQDRIKAQIADIKHRLVMKLLIRHIMQFGIWFEVSVHQRHVSGDHLDFLEPNHPLHSAYLQMKAQAIRSALSNYRSI